MKSQLLILFLFLCLPLHVFSTDKTLIRQACLVDKHAVQMPFVMDSTDVNGGKFKTQLLLSAFTPSIIDDYTKYPAVNADSAGIFNLPKPQSKTEIYYLEFRVYATRFAKTKLHVSSTCDFTVFVNGEKKDGTTATELALPKGTEKSIDINMVPQYYSIGLCCLLDSKAEAAPVLKIALSGDSGRVEQVPLTVKSLRKLGYEDIANYSSPNNVTVSYNGTFLLNKITTVLTDGEKSYSIEVIDRVSGKRVMQSSGHKDAAWMPKSEKLYSSEKLAGVRVLKALQPLTQEVQQLAKNIPEGVISWSPDESYLIVSTTDKYKDSDSDAKFYIQPQDRMSGWRNASYLSKLDLASGVVQQLTFGNREVSLHDISLDGKKIIFSTSETTMTQRPFTVSSFFQYDFSTNKIDSIWTKVPYISGVKYSPDASQLLVMGAPAAFNKLGENIGKRAYSNDYDVQAYLYDFATKKATALTRNFDPTIDQGTWNAADNCIYFKVTDRDCERVYRYSIAAKKFEMLPLPVDLVQQFDISGNGLYAAYRGMTASYPSRAFALNLKSNESVLISDTEKDKMSKIALGKVLDYNYKAKDGGTIYGRYYLPGDFDENKKYPMMVYYYGGTTPTQRTFNPYWNFHFWASLGYVVYVVEPSGAIGYGQEFSARHVNAWGDKTADDIIKGVKGFCSAHSFVDASKIGCLGASYGGFMTMYLQTKTNIFATAISHAGISALSSYWGDGYWGYEYSGVATADTYPWNNPKFYTEHSPLFNANKITTPLLLIQGEVDTNVPVGESTQMFTALKILGKPVSMIRIKNENHIISDYQHRRTWEYSIMAWMAKYLQNDSSWWESLYPESKQK